MDIIQKFKPTSSKIKGPKCYSNIKADRTILHKSLIDESIIIKLYSSWHKKNENKIYA